MFKTKQVYLVGAGFTKSIFPNDATLNKGLLNALTVYWETDVFEKYKKKYKNMNGDIWDIEKLLTYIDMEIGDEGYYNPESQSKLVQDRLEINEAIASYFKQFRFKKEILNKNKWLNCFSQNILQRDDVIVNLNYECFLEGMLDYLHLWEPINGYIGVHFHPDAKAEALKDKQVKIIKVHGSENFVISSCYPDENMKSIGCVFDEEIFPNSAQYSHLGGGMLEPKSYVIAPSFIKNTHVQITDMMLKAINVARIADTLIIIGCGIRKEDLFVRFFLTSFMNVENLNSKVKKKIIIVDYNAKELRNKISTFWSNNLKYHFEVLIFEDGLQNSISFLYQQIRKMT